MKKKIFSGALLLAIAATAAFNVNFNMNKSDKLSSLALANIEALASGESGSATWKIADKDCSISERVDANLEITLAGKKFKVANYSVGATYKKTWKNAARDCSTGGSSMCASTTCTTFYGSLTKL